MAIKNASDLLVYKKSPADVAQVTRIMVRTLIPLSAAPGTINVLNCADLSGVNVATTTVNSINPSNNGNTVLNAISAQLTTTLGYYTATATATDGDYNYKDFTNVHVGDLDNIISFSDGSVAINEGGIIVTLLTAGETYNDYEPIGHSTSASISFNKDLRDSTTKSSLGYQENVSGLTSFELSTDALQDINSDLEFKDFFNDINNSNEVSVRFAERTSGTKWEGSGYISSVSMDAGVEEATTYSVSITGTASVIKGTY